MNTEDEAIVKKFREKNPDTKLSNKKIRKMLKRVGEKYNKIRKEVQGESSLL